MYEGISYIFIMPDRYYISNESACTVVVISLVHAFMHSPI